jgi:hypothetical protein
VDRDLRELVLLSKPHEYWRWLDHTITYPIFKKEMWAKIPWKPISPKMFLTLRFIAG